MPVPDYLNPPGGTGSSGAIGAVQPSSFGGAGSAADIRGAAGPQQGAATYTPSSDAFTSNRLNQLLSSESPYLTLARNRAQSAAAARGLGNSSIAVGAAEDAAIGAAMPIAQADAGVTDSAGRFNVEQTNQFARDANQFGQQSALTAYQGGITVRGQDLDASLRREDLSQNARQFDARLGFDRERGAAEDNRFGLTFGLDRERFATDTRLREGALTLDQQRAADQREQFGQTFGLDRERLTADTRLREGALSLDQQRAADSREQFNRTLTLDQQRLDADNANQAARLGLDRDRFFNDVEQMGLDRALEQERIRIDAELRRQTGSRDDARLDIERNRLDAETRSRDSDRAQRDSERQADAEQELSRLQGARVDAINQLEQSQSLDADGKRAAINNTIEMYNTLLTNFATANGLTAPAAWATRAAPAPAPAPAPSGGSFDFSRGDMNSPAVNDWFREQWSTGG